MTHDETPDDESRISVFDFLENLWGERVFIIVVVLIAALLSEIYILHSPVKYTTTMLIGHVTSVETPGASTGSALGGGNAIALIGLGGGVSTDTKFNLFLTVIKTENFARMLESKYHYDRPHGEGTVLPTAGAVAGYLGGIIALPSGDMLTLQVQTEDRTFAKQFLVTIYNEGNQYVRLIDTRRAQKFAAFVEDRFRSENSRALQDALGTLLVNQERFLMVTSVDLPYAVQLIDGPISTVSPTSPNTKLLREIGLGVGLAGSIFVILVWEAVAAERRRRGLVTPGPSWCLIHSPWLLKRLVQKMARGYLGGEKASVDPRY